METKMENVVKNNSEKMEDNKRSKRNAPAKRKITTKTYIKNLDSYMKECD